MYNLQIKKKIKLIDTIEFELMTSAPWWLFFIIRPRHQLNFGVDGVWILEILFDNKILLLTIYQPKLYAQLMSKLNYTPSVQLCLSSIPFWDVSKYCSVFKNKIY